MKRTVTSVAIGAIVTMAGISQAHAWGFGDVFSDKKQTTVNQSAGGDARYQSLGKNSGGRDRWEIKNSFNRTNSPEIANSKNVNTGNTGGNTMQSAGQVRDIGNGTAKNARFSGIGSGNFRNDGLIGNNAGASQSSGGIDLGDKNDYSRTYMGNDAVNAQVRMREIDSQVEMKKIESKK